MNRRSVLRATGAVVPVGLAGCLSETGEEGTTSDVAEHPTSGSTEADGASSTANGSLSVEFDRLQPGVVLAGDDSIGVASDGRQFLYLNVEAGANSGSTAAAAGTDAPAADEFAFRFAGETHSPWRASGNAPLWRAWTDDDDARYAAETGSGWVLFELPEAGDASDATLEWNGLAWRPPESIQVRLAARPPSLSLDWSVPETTTPGETEIGFAVTNDGDRVGRFVGGLNETNIRSAYAPIEAFSRPVQPGETVSWTMTHDNGVTSGSDSVDDGEPDGAYVLSWQGGTRRREVSFVSNA